MTTADATAIRLNLDLESGLVSAPGRMIGIEALQPNLQALLADEGKEFAVIVLSKGDRRPIDVAMIAEGLPREVDLLSLKFAAKEFETGRRYDLHEGDGSGFSLVSRGGLPHYRTMAAMIAAQMQKILRSYADPRGTFVHLIGEIEAQFRYNPSDYSPGATYSALVPTGSQSVYVPVPLSQANGTRSYLLSVTGSILPAYTEEGWGSPPLVIANAAISITVSGGAVVGANLTISPATRTAESPSLTFTPHWLTSMDPIRVDPVTGGLELRVDVVTSAMSTTTFGSMPTTVWRARKVPMNQLWFNGNYLYNNNPGLPPDTFTFLNASGTVLGSHTIPGAIGSPTSVTNAVGNFFLYASRNPSNPNTSVHSDLVWKAEPTAKFVRCAGVDVPVVAEDVPTSPTIRFDVSLVAQGDEEDVEVTRVTSQSFVVQLRRDLIPDVAPDTGGS